MSIFSKMKARVNTAKLKVRVIAAGFTLVIASVAAVATMGGAAAAPSSTPDCDANAAVWCGVSQAGSVDKEITKVKSVYVNGDGHNKYYTIQDMYNYFGMSTDVINSMSTTNVVSGYVSGDASGDVYATINGQNTLVATGAITAGRQNIAGSTTVKYGATTFYTRPTHVSFENGELAALVIMKNGVFQNAILTSCGNPVKATPKKPNYSIAKQVRAGTSGSYGSSVSVKSGSTVQYQITVSSTGAIPVNNVTVHDTLPSGITYASGTLQENGSAVSSANASKFFSSGLVISTIKNGSKDVFTFQAKAGSVDYTDTSCKVGAFTNTGYIAAPGLSGMNSSAKVSTTCAPPASLACTSLTAIGDTADATTGDQKYTFTAKSSPQNVTISAYNFNFGDSATATVKSAAASVTTTHTYAPGTWTAEFSVTGTASATSKSYTSSACTYKVTVKPPVSGTLSCVGLTATPGKQDTTTGDTPYTLTGKGHANGNAKIAQYVFTPVSGGQTVSVNSSSTSASTQYTYAPGTYAASVQVTGTDIVTGKTITAPNNSACQVSITVKQPPKPNYSILKQVSTSANGTYSSNAQIKSGATVYYKITVSSTGNAPVTNVNVNDTLPSDIKYASGTLKQDGVAVSTSNASSFFGNGLVVSSIKNGSSTVFTYSAVAGNTSTDTDPSCKAETLDNTGYISTTGLSKQQSSAEVKTSCTQLPGSLACVALTAIAGKADATTGDQAYTFSGSATATNATIKTYTFTITNTDTNKVVATIPVSDGSQSVTTPSQTLAPGNYKAVVAVAGTDNYGNTLQAPTNAKCATTFKIPTPECKPGVQAGSSECYAYTCNLFTVSVDNNARKVTVTGFTASSTNPNIAKPGDVTIDWGDGTSSKVAYADATTQNHVFTADSSTITASTQFTTPDGSTPVTSTACSQPVSFTTIALPPTLPNTGAGDTIAIFVGVVATATVAFRMYTIRKLSRS